MGLPFNRIYDTRFLSDFVIKITFNIFGKYDGTIQLDFIFIGVHVMAVL